MGSRTKVIFLPVNESEFEALLRRASKFLRQQRLSQVGRPVGKPIARAPAKRNPPAA